MTDSATTTPPKKKWTRFVTPALALVAAIGVGVVVGVVVGQNTASSAAPTGFAQGQRPDGAQGFPGGNFTAGTITGIDGDVVTIELQDGSTVTVTATDDTTVTTTKESSVSDLAEGDTITVSGDKDDSGNVTSATSIREGETGFGGPGGGNGAPPTGTTAP